MLETFDSLSLEDQIEYAKWNLEVAQAQLDDLRKQKADFDAHIEAEYQEMLDREYGRVACESDIADRKVAEVLHVS